MFLKPVSIKRGDLWCPLTVRVRARDGFTLPDVTGAIGAFFVRTHCSGDAGTQLSGSITITADGDDVLLVYTWAPGETDTVADWDAEFEIELSGGLKWTVPGADENGAPLYIRLLVAQDLGDA